MKHFLKGGGIIGILRNSKSTHATRLNLVANDLEDIISYPVVIHFDALSRSKKKKLL